MHTPTTIGLGTWKSELGKVREAVRFAIEECSYRHIDCAAIYQNEAEIGEAFLTVFNGDKVKREDVFVTSKLWNDNHKPSRVEVACKQTLKDLQLEYLDLYLMHWGMSFPQDFSSGTATSAIFGQASVRDTWEAMKELVKNCLVKNIGVANFTGPMLFDLLTYAKVRPLMNQIELHPYLQQTDLVAFCLTEQIGVTAYSPLGSPGNLTAKGLPSLLDDETIVSIAKELSKTPAQVLLRWAVERDTVPIPKSVNPKRIVENITIDAFRLAEEHKKKISSLDRNLRFVNPIGWWKLPYFG